MGKHWRAVTIVWLAHAGVWGVAQNAGPLLAPTFSTDVGIAQPATVAGGDTKVGHSKITITSLVGMDQTIILKIVPPKNAETKKDASAEEFNWDFAESKQLKLTLGPGASQTVTLKGAGSSAKAGKLQIMSSLGYVSSVVLKNSKGQPYLLAYAPQTLKQYLRCWIACNKNNLILDEDITIKLKANKPFELGAVTGPKGEVKVMLDVPLNAKDMELPCKKGQPLALRLEGNLAPGEYKGELGTLAVGTATAALVPIVFEVREHWTMAALFVLFGLVAGILVQAVSAYWLPKQDLEIRRRKLQDKGLTIAVGSKTLSVSDFSERLEALKTDIKALGLDGGWRGWLNPSLDENGQKKVLNELQALETAVTQGQPIEKMAKELDALCYRADGQDNRLKMPDQSTNPNPNNNEMPHVFKVFEQMLTDRTVKVDDLTSEVTKYTSAVEAAKAFNAQSVRLTKLEKEYRDIKPDQSELENLLHAQAIMRMGEAESILWREGDNLATWQASMSTSLDGLSRILDGLRQAKTDSKKATDRGARMLEAQLQGMRIIPMPSTMIVLEPRPAPTVQQLVLGRNWVLGVLLWISVLVVCITGLREVYKDAKYFGGAADYFNAFMWGFTTKVVAEAVSAVFGRLPFGANLTNPIK